MAPDGPLANALASLQPSAEDLARLALVSKKFRAVAYIAATRRLRVYACRPAPWDETRHVANSIQRLRLHQMRWSYVTLLVHSAMDGPFPCMKLLSVFRESRNARFWLDEWSFVRLLADHPFSVHRLASERNLWGARNVVDGPSETLIGAVLALGVSPNYADEAGKFALDYAEDEGRAAVASELCRWGARRSCTGSKPPEPRRGVAPP